MYLQCFGRCVLRPSSCETRCCIAVIRIQLYTYTCGNRINNNDERTHFFRKIYLSLYSKWLRKVWEVTEQTATYWPPVPLFLAALLSRSADPNRGSWGSIALCWVLVLASYLAPGYIIVWHPPASCECRLCTQFNPSTVKVLPWYRLNAPVPWLTAGSKVKMLHRQLTWNWKQNPLFNPGG